MPKHKAPVDLAAVRSVWRLMEAMGYEPVSVKFHSDGTFRVMTRQHVEAKFASMPKPGANPQQDSAAAYDEWKLGKVT